MADKSGATGILRGIQNVLVFRRQNRMAEAKQELQNVNFQMLQRKADLAEAEHKSAQSYRKMQSDRARFIKTDQGLMDISTMKIVPDTAPKPETMSAMERQSMRIKAREQEQIQMAQSILSGPGAKSETPERKRYAEQILGFPAERGVTLGPGQLYKDQRTGELIAEGAPKEPSDFTLSPSQIRFGGAAGEQIAEVPPGEPPPQRLPGVAGVYEYREGLSPEKQVEFDAWYEETYRLDRDRPTQLVRDFDVIIKGIPEGLSPKLRKAYELREKAILDKWDIKGKKVSAFREKVNELQKFGPPSEEQILALIGVHSKKRQPTPKLMTISESVNFLTNIAIMLTGKDGNEGNDAIKELKNNPEKYLEAFTEQVHLLGGGTAKEGIPAFYGYASQMIGQTINPEGAVKSVPAPEAAPEQLVPPQSWQEVVDRGEPITDEEYRALKKVLGETIPDELTDAIADLHIWEE